MNEHSVTAQRADARTSDATLSAAALGNRALRHYWRLNALVALAVAVAVAVLAGALVVGDSVRASLHALAFERLGRIQTVLQGGHGGEHYFREALATALPEGAPVIVATGGATHAGTGARAARVQALGITPAFWTYEAMDDKGTPMPNAVSSFPPLAEGEAWINEPLARELQAKVGDDILLRVQIPSPVPRASFMGERDETVATLRLTVRRIVPARRLGRFSLAPSQFDPLNVYVPLAELQRRLEVQGKVNLALTNANRQSAEVAVNTHARLADYGLKLRDLKARPLRILESDSIYLPLALNLQQSLPGAHPRPVLTYLANAITPGDRSRASAADDAPTTAAAMVPYSTVTALDDLGLKQGEIALNAWTAAQLGARVGDAIGLTYFIEGTRGALAERTTTFTLARIVPVDDPLSDPALAPELPGVSDAEHLSDWDPPFPLDLDRIRPEDEAYWDQYRATPKAYIGFTQGQELWGTAWGNVTGMRLDPSDPGLGLPPEPPLEQRVQSTITGGDDGLANWGLRVMPVRERAIAASRGASDFGGLFIGFSLFLLVSAALLIRILFQLGVESRARQLGLLGAVGWPARRIRRLLIREGAIVAGVGALAGAALAVGFAALMLHGLRTWWVGSIGTPFLILSVQPASLAGGVVGGWLVALGAIWWALRGVIKLPPRALLAGAVAEPRLAEAGRRRAGRWAIGLFAAAIALTFFGASRPAAEQAGMFFGVGALLLASGLLALRAWLAHERPGRPERLSVARLGLGNARRRPGRSLMVVGLVASATFILVATAANRRTMRPGTDPRSGTGGYALIGESTLPIYEPLHSARPGVRIMNLRLRAGDDASCLNLYQSAEPRVAGMPEEFILRGGFSFGALAVAGPVYRDHPWKILTSWGDGEFFGPLAFGDANTLQWLLKLGLGDRIQIGGVTLQIAGMLKGSVFQSELLISEAQFKRAFPEEAGWRMFLVECDPAIASEIERELEAAYESYGLDLTSTAERMNQLLRVENTYLSTFQALGGLGLLLGTIGLGLALARNLIERRAELALLRAVGYSRRALVWLASVETLALLAAGLALGTLAALVAVAPGLAGRVLTPPWGALAATLALIALAGAAATVLAARAVVRMALLPALKSE